MSDRFAFSLDLRDGSSDNAASIAKGLRNVEDGLKHASLELRKLERETDLKKLDKLKDPIEKQKYALNMGIRAMREHQQELLAAQKTADDVARAEAKAARLATKEVRDKEREVAKAARAEAKAVREAEREKEKATREAAKASKKAAEEQKESWSSVATGLSSVLHIAQSVASAFMAIGGAAYNMGKYVVGVLAKKESTLASLKLMLGSDEKAGAAYAQALAYAKKTPFQTGEVVDSFKQLYSAGFTEKETPILFQAVGDLASSSGTGGEGMNRVIRALSQIKGAGTLKTEDLNQIMEVASLGGISRKAIFDNIAGFKGGGMKGTAVPDLISKGGVTSEEGILAILDAVKKVSGGELGKQIQTQSTTISGLLSTLESTGEDFISSMDLKNLPGLDAFKGTLKNVTDLLDSTGATGQRLQAVLEKAFNSIMVSVFGRFSGEEGAKGMEMMLNKVIDVIENTDWAGGFKTLKETFDAILTVGKAVWWVIDLIGEVVGGVGRYIGFVFGMIFTIVDKTIDFVAARIRSTMKVINFALDGEFSKAGEAAAEGFRDGIWGGQTGVIAVSEGLARASKEGMKDVLKIRSPSQVMKELGAYTAEGFEMGVEGGTARVGAAAGRMAGAAMQGVTGGAGAGGASGGVVVQGPLVAITVPAVPGMTAEDLAREIQRLAPGLFADALTTLAIQSGAMGGP